MDDLRKFADDLRGMDKKLKHEMEGALDRTVPVVAATATTLLPPNTGIRIFYTTSGMSRMIFAVGTTTDPEAEEYGTSQKSPNPFMTMALMASLSRFMNESGTAIDRAFR